MHRLEKRVLRLEQMKGNGMGPIQENVNVCLEELRVNINQINTDYEALDPRSVAMAKTKLEEFELWIKKAFDSEEKK